MSEPLNEPSWEAMYYQERAAMEAENSDLKSYLKQYRDNEAGLLARCAALAQERDALRSWVKAANQFAWSHERDCPRRVSEGTCECGLDQFLGRPRPFIESYKQRITQLEQQLEAAQVRLSELERQLEAEWEKVKIAVDALVIYADPRNWKSINSARDTTFHPDICGGFDRFGPKHGNTFAKDALAALRATEVKP